jgi:hypothetical protein
MMRTRCCLLVSLFVVLSGCMSVTPRGLIAMARFDPLQMNPSDLGAGLGVPEAIRLADGDAMIVMTYQVRGEPSPRVNERFLLEISDSAGVDGAPLPARGERIYIGRLSRLDSMRMKDVQQRILRYQSEGLRGQGSFSISLRGGCTTVQPLTELPFHTFVKTSPNQTYVETTRRTDFIASLQGQEREVFLRGFRACDQSD